MATSMRISAAQKETCTSPSRLYLLCLILLFTGAVPAFAADGIAVNNSGPMTYNASATAILAAPNLSVSFATASNLDEAKINISSGYQKGADVLGIEGQSGNSGSVDGLNWSWDASIGVLTLSGAANEATYQSALRQITYVNTSSSPTAVQRTLTFSLGSGLQYPVTGHFYEYIPQANVTWTQAKQAAATRNYFGLSGYMATVTSSGESQFLLNKLKGHEAWIGASDAAVPDEWRWVTGPEGQEDGGKGKLFWLGQANGSAVAGSFTNWNPNEPNNSGDSAYFIGTGCSWGGCQPSKWDDVPASTQKAGYLVEYGGSPGDPSLQLSDDALINVEVAPVATPDTYSVSEDGTLTRPVAGGVLHNDHDANSDPLTAQLDSDVTHGTLSLNADGSFTYTPTPLFSGTDSFTYHANDGVFDSNIATVTLTVQHVNHAPVAHADNKTTPEDTAVVIDVLANDTDADVHDSLHAIKVTDPTNGTLVLNTDGSFSYTPNADFNGSDSFTYKANDGHTDSNTTTVTITVTAVNDAPVAQADGYSIAEDTTLHSAISVLANDSDPEGNAITAIKVTDPANGTLQFNSDGNFQYTPNTNFNGNDSFTYHATDGHLSSADVSVTISVTPVNDAPKGLPDTYNVHEDTGLSIDATSGLLKNDSDPEHNSLTVKLGATHVSHGTLHLSPDGSFDYTPEKDYNGPDSFTYKVNDGQLDSSEVPVTLIVDAVNDAPVAVTDAYTTQEEALLTVNVNHGLLANDSDPDGDALTALLITQAANGVLQFSLDGSFTYLPKTNFSGTDSFSYKVTDGKLESAVTTVNLTVHNVNDAPLAANDSYSTQEDNPLKVDGANGVLTNDIDFDGDTLQARLSSQASNGTVHLALDGGFTYTPKQDFNGTDSFTYRAFDGHLESGVVTVSIDVHATDDTPVAADDHYSIGQDGLLKVLSAEGVLSNDHDADGDNLRLGRIVSSVSHGWLQMQLDGSFTYRPEFGFFGTDSFTYTAYDGKSDSIEAQVDITVNHVNHPPLPNNDSYSVAEDGTLLVAVDHGLLTNDLDIDGDKLLIKRIVSDVAHGALHLALDGSFTYKPTPGYSGTDSFTYEVTDGAADVGPVTVMLTVNHINHTPLASADSYSLPQNGVLTVPAPGLLANDLDIDGDQLLALIQSYPQHGALHQDLDGGFIYQPAPDYEGTDSYAYMVTDGVENSNVVQVSLTIQHSNHPPLAGDDNYSTPRDVVLQIDPATGVLKNDLDPDSNILTAVIVGQPKYGSLQLEKDGSFKYTPDAGRAGLDEFTYQASDGVLTSNVARVIIDVSFTNRAPTAADDAYATQRDTVLQVDTYHGLLANDTDLDGDTLTVTVVDQPQHGSLHMQTNGSFNYTPGSNYAGPDSFTYKVSDGQLSSGLATVTLEVHATNHPPKAVDDLYSVDQDTRLTVNPKGVLANDTDEDGNTLKSFIVTNPANGSLIFNPDGSFTFTPNSGFNGSDSFTYRVFDGKDYSTAAKVTIAVNTTYRLQVSVKGQGRATGGLVSTKSAMKPASAGAIIDCPPHCEATFPSGSVVRLIAEINFDVTKGSWAWPGVCPDNQAYCDYTMDANKSATVIFNCDLIDIPRHDRATATEVSSLEAPWVCDSLRALNGFEIVAPNGEISFRAQNSITLGPGFKVELGGVFHAVMTLTAP